MPQLSDNDIKEILYWLRKLKNLRGDGVTNTRDGILIKWPAIPKIPQFTLPLALILPSGNATPGGMYTAKRVLPASKFISTTASTINDPDLETSPGVDDCYAVNSQEIGQTTHMLILDGSISPTLFIGWYCGPADDGKPVYLIDAVQGAYCDPNA